MKMILTPLVEPAENYTGYVHNCLRNPACEPSYSAPLPGIPYLQLYVEFGAYKPVIVEFQLIDHCAGGETEQIFPSNFVVGRSPDGTWYGVFKYFGSPMNPVTTFSVWLSAFVESPSGLQELTYFSEMLMVEPCQPLTKIKACQPAGATITGFDINGVYYGVPVDDEYLGIAEIRYFHIAYVRLGKVREMSNKATFKSSLTRNFRTTIEKIFQVETELVPQWYKDELLAIYARGAVSINDGPAYLVSDLNFEGINDDDLIWKPYAQLKKTFRLFFGCDNSECIECCSPIVLSAHATSAGGESTSESEPPLGSNEFRISYTNNENIPVYLGYHNGGAGPLTDLHNGTYDTDPIIGSDPGLPAVDALVVLQIGGGKTFIQVRCNGVLNPLAVGNNIATWAGVNGPIEINFLTT